MSAGAIGVTMVRRSTRRVSDIGSAVAGDSDDEATGTVAARAASTRSTISAHNRATVGDSSSASVKDFAAKVRPLPNLIKKGAVFNWTPDCKNAFLDLKHALLTAPILVASCNDRQYVLDTDASDTALGTVLQQEQGGKLHVIGYASRTLAPSETWYCITR